MSTLAYEVEKLGAEKVMLSPSSRTMLGQVDAVVFDCDGVLIDVRRSYDLAILRTATSMLDGFAGWSMPLERFGGELILSIRGTGGFNDDWDTAYAMTIFSALAVGNGPSGVGASAAVRKLRELVKGFSSRERLKGRASVDEYLQQEGLESSLTVRLREYIDYRVDPAHTLMTRVFDEMYYGGEMFQRIFGEKPTASTGEGLMEKERVLITAESLKRLKKLLGGTRIAMATGRPFVAVQYTLGPLLQYFDQEASVYIGDGDVYPELAPQLMEFKKPSGASLVRAYREFSSNALLYVGDSAEDRLMVRDAERTCGQLLFGGIYGTSFNEADQIAYFTRNGSDVVARTVQSVPLILERLRA